MTNTCGAETLYLISTQFLLPSSLFSALPFARLIIYDLLKGCFDVYGKNCLAFLDTVDSIGFLKYALNINDFCHCHRDIVTIIWTS